MYIRMQDVIALEEFKGCKIVAGEDGLNNIVNNAALMEVPDIFPYLESSNLLITTLYPIYNDEKAVGELIPKLVELNIAGICIKPGRYIKGINPIMIQQANEFNFPIIELAENANLSKLANAVLEASLNKHIDVLNFRNYVHRSLMDLFLKGEDINALINSLAEIVKFPVLLLDKDLQILDLSKEISGENISIDFSFENKNSDFIVNVGEKKYNEKSYIKYSIKAGNTRFGYIVLLKDEVENQNLIVAVEQASLLIASVFYKNYAVMEKEKSFQNAFIRDLLKEKISSPSIDIIKRAETFGWKMEFPEVIMVIKLLTDDDKKKKDKYEEILDSNIIEKTLEKHLSINRNKFKTVYIDDSLVVFINSIFVSKVKENFIGVGKLIIGVLKYKIKVGIGISSIVNNIESFSLAYKEAQDSIVVGAILNQDSFVSHYSDYEMFSIIKEVKDEKVLKKYLNEKLGKLIEYDKSVNMELLETLKVLIDENFNVKKASEKLFIHYNTLRYRIERIKELGLDIEDGFSIGELVLAYNIYLWLKANES